MDEGEAFRICTVMRAYIIAALESESLRLSGGLPGHWHAIDLRCAAPVGCKNDMLSIWRKTWFRIDSRTLGKPLQASSIAIDKKDLRASHQGKHHGKFFSIRGPCRSTVAAPEVGDRL